MTLIDYAALGFRLTLADAARVLELKSEEVIDLLLCGELTALVTSGSESARSTRVRLHPDEVAAYAQRRRAGLLTADTHNLRRVHTLLRDYLAARPPVDSYAEALSGGHPLRGVPRRATDPDPVYVRPEALAEFHASRGGEFPVPASLVGRGLETLGAVRARGVTAKADQGSGKQRWAYWYRLPLALSRPFREHDLAPGLLGRTRDPEEEVRLAGGAPVVAEPVRGVADDLEEEYDGDFSDV